MPYKDANIFTPKTNIVNKRDLEIEDFIYSDDTSIVGIVKVPEGITSIGIGAFDGCTNITEVILPESLREILLTSFGNCQNLERINFPDNLVRIEMGAFNECKKLKEIKFGNSLRVIGHTAFAYCESLTGVLVIPKSVKIIEPFTFSNCNFSEIHIPKDNNYNNKWNEHCKAKIIYY